MDAKQFLRENEISSCVGEMQDWIVDTTEEQVADAMEKYTALKVKESLVVSKAITEHLDQQERNEYFESKIEKL